jgi:hypothetical protein
MPRLLIRDIPQRPKDWIDHNSYKLHTSQKEFVLSVLTRIRANPFRTICEPTSRP